MSYIRYDITSLIMKLLPKPLQAYLKQDLSLCNTDTICNWADKKGYLEVLQWARANGCPWDKWIC